MIHSGIHGIHPYVVIFNRRDEQVLQPKYYTEQNHIAISSSSKDTHLYYDPDKNYNEMYKVFCLTVFYINNQLIIPVAVFGMEDKDVLRLVEGRNQKIYLPWRGDSLVIYTKQISTYDYHEGHVQAACKIANQYCNRSEPSQISSTKVIEDKLNNDLFKIKLLTLKQDE